MISIERILCPAASSPESDEALRYAASLARAFKARLYLCHCASAPALITRLAAGAANGHVTKLLMDSLARYLGSADSGELNWRVLVSEGGKDVGAEIVRVACERHVDLIVMRARRSGVATLLGSTAEQVSRTASCPVLVIRPKEFEQNGDSKNEAAFRRVLVSHDFSSGSELALSYALSIAQEYGADLHLLHVLPELKEDEPEIAWGRAGVESAYQRATVRLQDSVPGEVYLRCRVTLAVRCGKPYREALAYAREQTIDLVCMGALGKDFGLEALFGSNVDRVLRQSRCPVLVAHPLKPATPPSLDLRIEAVR
jgi:nucleotide-binding universal stress UspA family protein